MVEEFLNPGMYPGRCGTRPTVEDIFSGKGEGTRSAARSVSTKWPPSI